MQLGHLGHCFQDEHDDVHECMCDTCGGGMAAARGSDRRAGRRRRARHTENMAAKEATASKGEFRATGGNSLRALYDGGHLRYLIAIT